MHTLTEIQEKIHWNQVMMHGYDPICDAFSSWWLKLYTHMKNMLPSNWIMKPQVSGWTSKKNIELPPPSSASKSQHHTFQELFVMRSQLQESQFAANALSFLFRVMLLRPSALRRWSISLPSHRLNHSQKNESPRHRPWKGTFPNRSVVFQPPVLRGRARC